MKKELLDRLESAANLAGNGRCYAGMGAGDAPAGVRMVLSEIAAALFKRGWMLRSGGSVGADIAFEEGAEHRKEIFFPKDATVEAHLIAQRYCRDWNRRTSFAKNLLARKSMILLGAKLDNPVSALICWTTNGQPTRVGRAKPFASPQDMAFRFTISSTMHSLNLAAASSLPIARVSRNTLARCGGRPGYEWARTVRSVHSVDKEKLRGFSQSRRRPSKR